MFDFMKKKEIVRLARQAREIVRRAVADRGNGCGERDERHGCASPNYFEIRHFVLIWAGSKMSSTTRLAAARSGVFALACMPPAIARVLHSSNTFAGTTPPLNRFIQKPILSL